MREFSSVCFVVFSMYQKNEIKFYMFYIDLVFILAETNKMVVEFPFVSTVYENREHLRGIIAATIKNQTVTGYTVDATYKIRRQGDHAVYRPARSFLRRFGHLYRLGEMTEWNSPGELLAYVDKIYLGSFTRLSVFFWVIKIKCIE